MAEFRKRPGAAATLQSAGVVMDPPRDSTSPPAEEEPGGPSKSPEREFTVEARSQFQTIRRRFFRHKLAMVSLALLTFVVALSFLGPRLWPYGYSETNTEDASNAEGKGGPSISAPPRCEGGEDSTVDRNGIEHSCTPHIMGTDSLGLDTFAQVMRGTQKSLQIAFMVAFLATFIGVIIGAISGFYAGGVDTALMRVVDLFLTVPAVVIAGCLGAKVQGGDWWLLGLILGGVAWTTIARIIRGEFLSLREKEFVEAARALGASDGRIIFKHMLPNVIGSIIVNATLLTAAAILLETALSYLGLGVKAPDTSLGLIVNTYQTAFTTRPWLFWFPGVFIIVIALCVNFIGDGLRDAFDPKQTRVRA